MNREPAPPEPSPPVAGGAARLAYRAVGILALVFAAAGAALPLLPTVPFLLVALWAFARGAPAWADRLRRHPRFGPPLVAWEARRAIPRPAKAAASVAMTGGWTSLVVLHPDVWLAAGAGAAFAAVMAWILSRPSR